jgi:hypothetical protein
MYLSVILLLLLCLILDLLGGLIEQLSEMAADQHHAILRIALHSRRLRGLHL